MYADFHIHTRFSADSDASAEAAVKRCIKLGMSEMCFTDHNDFNWPVPGEDFTLDTENYFKEINYLARKYSDRIAVRTGVECGLAKENDSENASLTGSRPFDFVIGSCHIVDGTDPYDPAFFEGTGSREAFEKYFLALSQSVNGFFDFDVLGHLDYVVRYAPDKDADYSPADFMDLIDGVLKKLIGAGKGIEINTSGLRQGLPFANPCPEILKRYRELGGEIITIGSDAHTTDQIGYEFDRAGDFLKKAGFTRYCTFRGRKPRFIEL